MFISKIFKVIFLIFISFAFIVESFSVEKNNKELSIGEIKTNIKNLTKKKEAVNESWEYFLKNNGKIKDFLRNDLKKEEIEKIMILSKKLGYSDNRRKKIDFYKKLYPNFINIEKKERFFSYIKEEIKKLKEENNIKEKINIQKKVLEKKVEKYSSIKEKYDKKKDLLVRNVIKRKIIEKIDNIEQRDSFKTLDISRKIFLYETFVEKIKARKKIFLKSYNDKNIKQQRKLIILEVLIDNLTNRLVIMKSK